MERIVWFKFDPIKWLTGRIQRTPAETQVAFIRLCCIYWANDCKMTMKRAMLEAGADHLSTLLEMEIVMESDNNVNIEFLDELYLEASEKSRKAKVKAEKRWSNAEEKQSSSNAEAMPQQSNGNATAMLQHSYSNAEERRGEERREEEITTTSLIVADDALNRKHAKILIADDLFLGLAAMNNKVNNKKKIQDYIVSFHEHLAQDEKEHPKLTDFKRHFNNWLRIQTTQGIQPTHRYES